MKQTEVLSLTGLIAVDWAETEVTAVKLAFAARNKRKQGKGEHR